MSIWRLVALPLSFVFSFVSLFIFQFLFTSYNFQLHFSPFTFPYTLLHIILYSFSCIRDSFSSLFLISPSLHSTMSGLSVAIEAWLFRSFLKFLLEKLIKVRSSRRSRPQLAIVVADVCSCLDMHRMLW
jgi:hypothetical protein